VSFDDDSQVWREQVTVYLPNIISVSRFFFAPIIIWLIVSENLTGAFIVFLIAGLTDALDGFIARRFNMLTELGAYLDPIADKALLMSTFVTLGYFNYLPAWLAITVVSRDVLIIGAVMLSWLMGRAMEVKPLRISKFNTVMQITVAVLVLAESGLQLGLHDYVVVTSWVTGATTIASAVMYLVVWLRFMASYDINSSKQTAVDDRKTTATDGTHQKNDHHANASF
jgi:cardiolipin synthase